MLQQYLVDNSTTPVVIKPCPQTMSSVLQAMFSTDSCCVMLWNIWVILSNTCGQGLNAFAWGEHLENSWLLHKVLPDDE